MKKLLEEHADIETKIYEYFGTSTNYEHLGDYTDDYWDCDGNAVHWSPDELDLTDSDREAMYSEAVHSYYKKEDYTMLSLRLGTGDTETAIFDNSKRRDYLSKF